MAETGNDSGASLSNRPWASSAAARRGSLETTRAPPPGRFTAAMPLRSFVLASPSEKSGESRGVQTLVVPDLGDFEDVEIIEVHISNGDEVSVDDPLVTLETDKAAMDVPSTAAGRIESVLVRVGDKVSAGASLAIIDAVEAPARAEDWQLFSLAADPREERDVGAEHPEIRADLHRRFLRHREADAR